jgi:Protein of unknown function (DUF1488)
MALSFPNRSRSYDATRHAVRFWGYDSVIECAFLMTEEALKRIRPDARPDEEGLLNAFDQNVDLIYAAAAKVYARGRKGYYALAANDFWSTAPLVSQLSGYSPPKENDMAKGQKRSNREAKKPKVVKPKEPVLSSFPVRGKANAGQGKK